MGQYVKDFGLILEGRSDHAVIERILFSFFQNPDLVITGIVPAQDATDASISQLPTGWGNVRAHLQNEVDFLSNFETTEYIVIQIDSDCSDEFGVPHNHSTDGREKTVEELVEDIVQKLIEWIRPENYKEVKERVIFAIAVHEIECWLLPIYFENKPASYGKTVNCINTLNTVLPAKEGFYIHEKDYHHYEQMARGYKKQKDLLHLGPRNPSLAIFLEKLANVQLS